MADHTILCVHGIGSVESDPNWDQPWITAITNGFGAPQSGNNLQFATLAYDHLFEQFPAGAPQYLEAVAELLASAAWHTLTDPFRARGFGLPDIGKYAGRWYAGMVAQWVSEPDLRTACRQALAAEIERSNPDIICAHSLGTLLCYDLFSQDQQGPAVIAGRVFVTLGSQIGNTFVRAKAWGGRIPMINAVKWYHLFNHQDQAFTAEIQEPGIANFQEIFADSPAGHSPTNQGGSPGYLDHPNTISAVWHVLAKQPDKTIAARAIDGASDRSGICADREPLLVWRDHRRLAALYGISEFRNSDFVFRREFADEAMDREIASYVQAKRESRQQALATTRPESLHKDRRLV